MLIRQRFVLYCLKDLRKFLAFGSKKRKTHSKYNRNVKVTTPFDVDSELTATHYTYFDSTGRTMVVLEKHNVVKEHELPFQVSLQKHNREVTNDIFTRLNTSIPALVSYKSLLLFHLRCSYFLSQVLLSTRCLSLLALKR